MFRNSITPVLAVRGGSQAVAFYTRAFGAEELRREAFGEGRVIVELGVGEARFRVTDETEPNPGPQSLGGTSVRLNLFVADPDRFVERAIAHGATLIAAVADQPFGLRQGRVADPYGHHWLIGRPLDGEAGDWARR
jgi:PhnB protein